jgi:cell division protein FtsL
MTNRRRNHAQVQAKPVRRKTQPALRLVPRMSAAAEQAAQRVRPANLLRSIDLPPALATLVGVAILALVGVIYLTQVTNVTNANYTYQSLQAEHEKLLREQGDLQLQIGRAQSLPNIETIARDKLHMVPVGEKYTYLKVDTGPLAAMPPLPTPVWPPPTATAEP